MVSPELVFLLGSIYLAFQQETICDEGVNRSTEANSHFGEFEQYENHLLDAPQLGTTRVFSAVECALGCVRHSACLSFNIEIPNQLNTKTSLLCQLLSSGMLGNSWRLRRSKKFHHYGFSSPCLNSPCGSGGTCVPDYHNGLYTCSCPAEGSSGVPGSFSNPGRSCKDIKGKNGHSLGDGEYWIDPFDTGTPFTANCDMTTDGGGWTMVKQLLVPNDILQLKERDFSDDYRALSNCLQNSLYVSSKVLKVLRPTMDFQQLRWYCFKKSRGRVFHVMTTNDTAGYHVLEYFFEDSDTPATACDSFIRLPDDNSTLAQNCHQWGGGNQWGCPSTSRKRRIYRNVSTWVAGAKSVSLLPNFWCDDQGKLPSLSAGDLWRMYVR